MSTIMKVYDTFLDDDTMRGQTVIGSLDNLHFMEMPPYPDDSMRWMKEESNAYWEQAYKDVAKARNGV